MKHFYPDNNSLTVLRMIITIFILTIIAAMKYYIPSAKFVIITGIILAAIGFIIMFVYLPIYFSSIKYIVTDSEITKTCGVFIKTHQTVRFSSIQYTTIIRTPFSKYTGLNIIIFFVFGGQLRLTFIGYNDMLEILKLTGSVSGKEI